jgi:glycosyltransferase involved in cell wall biosynthesis
MNRTTTVIIPSYNAEMTIKKAIQSVREQTCYEDTISHVVIVNDGSTDKTRDVIVKLLDNLQDHKIELHDIDNSGPSAARNFGIKIADSEWVAFLDSDDTWLPDKLSTQLEVARRFPDAGLISCASNMIRGSYGQRIDENTFRFGLNKYLAKSKISTPTVLVKRTALLEAGLFDENMKYAEDENLFMKIVAKNTSYYIDKPLVNLSDKMTFGESGLSSNLKMMHAGRLKNINECNSLDFINIVDFVALRVIEDIKYTRRIVLTKYAKKRLTFVNSMHAALAGRRGR